MSQDSSEDEAYSFESVVNSIHRYWNHFFSETPFKPPSETRVGSMYFARLYLEALQNLAKYTAHHGWYDNVEARGELMKTLRRRAEAEGIEGGLSRDVTVDDLVETWQRAKRRKEEKDAKEVANENAARYGYRPVDDRTNDRSHRRRSRSGGMDERDNDLGRRDRGRHMPRGDDRSSLPRRSASDPSYHRRLRTGRGGRCRSPARENLPSAPSASLAPAPPASPGIPVKEATSPMTDMQEYICGTWNLNSTLDFFTPPLPPQPRYRSMDPGLTRALFLLAKSTSSVETARNALFTRLGQIMARDPPCRIDEVTAGDVDKARDNVTENMEVWALRRYNASAASRKRDEERWERYRGEYEREYMDTLRSREREKSDRSTERRLRSVPRCDSRDDRRRSLFRSPVGRSPCRYRQRSESPPRPRRRESHTSNVSVPLDRPQPSFQRSRPVDQPANRGATTEHFSEYAIETPDLVADPHGATSDENLGLRDEAVQMLGAQEEYYEAVRRKMLARYMARVQMYEIKVIETRKRVAGEERTRNNRDDKGRGRETRRHERERSYRRRR